jgi:putative ABC transport system substrate-binding protein
MLRGPITRRYFVSCLGGAAAAWPLAARAQQPAMPVVGFLGSSSAQVSVKNLEAFRKGLSETGYVEGRNVAIEFRWTGGREDRMLELAADLVRRQVAVIATAGNVPTLAAKAATATIAIVLGVGDDPIRLGLVASFARPGGNLTGINFFNAELTAKRLRLLHDLVPKAFRVAVLLNPANASSTESQLRIVQEAAPTIGLQIQILNATTIGEIDAAFATLERERPDALFVAGDEFFVSRAVQFATLTARGKIPTTYSLRDYVAVGGLMSYGTDFTEAFRQVGVYTGKILKGAKPVELPVVQSTKFEFVINMQTARALGLEVPAQLLATVDEVIE